jgi:hypothetical protein
VINGRVGAHQAPDHLDRTTARVRRGRDVAQERLLLLRGEVDYAVGRGSGAAFGVEVIKQTTGELDGRVQGAS